MTTASTPSGVSSTGATLSGSYAGATGTVTETGFYYGTGSPSTKVTATGTSSPFSKALTGLSANTTYYYKAYIVEGGHEVLGGQQSFKTKAVATATVTTAAATAVTAATATLNASFSGATGTIYDRGFRYRKGSGSWVTPTGLGSTAGTSGSFSMEISSLEESSTYTFQAYVTEWDENSGSYVDIWASDTQTFTTAAQSSQTVSGWLELPSYTAASLAGTTTSSLSDLYYLQHDATMGGKTQRNYTCLYDPEMYASYWVAYPLCYDHKNGSGRSNQWAYDPLVPQSKQTNCVDGAYGVNVSTPNYPNNLYSRGHQIANADRNGVDDMCDQTFYMTNLTPQIQNGFNGGIWNNLETAVQNLTSSCDTVYVVSGAAFRKKGGSESITTIVNTRDDKTLPVPNYYWKALLKVTWSGGTVTAASAVGFWMPHQDLKGESYTSYTVSVDQIETWTGLDLFANLPGDNSSGIEKTAEANTSWTTFQDW